MNFDEFRQASKRTMRFEPEHRANAALGLVGEIGEWREARSDRALEAGDVMFYLAWLSLIYQAPIDGDDCRKTYDSDHLIDSAFIIADMVKKDVYHDKPLNIASLCTHMTNIYRFIRTYHEDLSTIYQANIAKLLIRHPIDRGYTNEGQNMRADEIVKHAQSGNAEQTAAQYEGKTASQTLHDNTQALAVALDNAKQALSNVVNSLLVKRTPELPDPFVNVLLWIEGEWTQAWYDNDEDDWTINGDFDYLLVDGQYWMMMPTFNPESK